MLPCKTFSSLCFIFLLSCNPRKTFCTFKDEKPGHLVRVWIMKQWITSESTVHQQGGLTACSVQVLAGGGSEQCPLSSFGLAPGEGLQET